MSPSRASRQKAAPQAPARRVDSACRSQRPDFRAWISGERNMAGALSLQDANCLNAAASTFEERGTTVPFTTQGLLYSRVRKSNNNQLEVLVSGFSGGRCIYVLPWAAISELFRLTLHDKALHAEISFSDATTPDRIRMAAYRVAKSGLGGAELIKLAANHIEQEEKEQVSIRFWMMVRLIELTGVNEKSKELTLNYVNSPDGQMMVREAFRRFGARLKMNPQTCHSKIAEISEMIQPVGFNSHARRGRMRRQTERLTSFRDAVICSDIGGSSRILAEVSQLTLKIANSLLGAIDAMINDIPALMIDWDNKHHSIRNEIERLAWLLDGWNYVCDLWDDAVSGDPIKQDRIVEILRIIPMVPRSEIAATQAPSIAELTHKRSRLVQPNQDWRTGVTDHDMLRRMERGRG
jgi:hypothetical protein